MNRTKPSTEGSIELQVSVATDVATPTTQGRKVQCLTNNKARRERQRGQRRAPTDRPGHFPYTLPHIPRSSITQQSSTLHNHTLKPRTDSLIDSLPHVQRSKIIDNFRQKFLRRTRSRLDNEGIGHSQKAHLRRRVFHLLCLRDCHQKISHIANP
jgi:hypothetical protein